MRTKTLTILIITLCILAGLGIWISRSRIPRPAEDIMGSQLLAQVPYNEIAAVTIKDSKNTVLLKKTDEQWVVESCFDYPADFGKLSNLVRDLKEVKIGRKFEATEDTLARLSLKPPDQLDTAEEDKGTELCLKDKKDATIICVLLGKTRYAKEGRQIPEGRYITLKNEPDIYLVDKPFSRLPKDPTEWLNEDLLKIEADEVKSIASMKTGEKRPVYLFERPDKGKEMQPVNIKSGEKIDQYAVNSLASALSYLKIEDVVDRSEDTNQLTGIVNSAWIEYHLFNGTIYRIYTNKECTHPDPCYMRLEVDYQKPVTTTTKAAEKETSTEEGTSPEKSPEELSSGAKSQNERLGRWIYKVSERQHSTFKKELEQLFEDSNSSK